MNIEDFVNHSSVNAGNDGGELDASLLWNAHIFITIFSAGITPFDYANIAEFECTYIEPNVTHFGSTHYLTYQASVQLIT